MGYWPGIATLEQCNFKKYCLRKRPKGVIVSNSYTKESCYYCTALAEEGLFGKACRMLTSSGIADNNEETWELLKTKHPYVPIPTHPTSVPSQSSADLLPSDLDIHAVLRSFPKDTSCGPSGLRVQHLLDASEASLPTSLLSALKAVVNKLASGRALPKIAEYLAGATVIASS